MRNWLKRSLAGVSIIIEVEAKDEGTIKLS